jgi:hypothetical protein
MKKNQTKNDSYCDYNIFKENKIIKKTKRKEEISLKEIRKYQRSTE